LSRFSFAKNTSHIRQNGFGLLDLIASQLAKAVGVTEDLKAHDQLEWIRRMNYCRARAEEQVIREIVLL
jgi:hypothetical protein